MAGFRGLSKTARKQVLRTARGAMGEPADAPPEKPMPADQLAGLDWRNVSSTNVARGAYVPDFHRLFLEFKSGAVYKYEGIEPGMWQGFVSAPSKGRWVYYLLRNRGQDDFYAYERVR